MALEILFILVFILFAGLTVVGVPGPLLIAIGTLVYGYQTNFQPITTKTIIIFFALGIISIFVDNLFVLFGAKKYGASKFGMIGAFLGFFAVFLVGPPGIVIGPPLGAFLAEKLFNKKTNDEALKASLGAILGLITGILFQVLIAITLIVWFGILVF